MKVLLTGGGSGGHVTPILAVAAELKSLKPDTRITYIGQVGDKLADIPAADPSIDEVYNIRAGKFRRFHGEGVWQFFDLITLLKNFRDLIFIVIGFFQSLILLNREKPDVIFSRGSYISVPLCLAAAIKKVPYITHDSDPLPSLTNRIIARWAALHCVALPKALYPYPKDKTVVTGIPLSKKFIPLTPELKNKYRQAINLPINAQVIFIIGGGLGSQIVNTAVINVAQHLLQQHPNLYLVHAVGKSNETEATQLYSEGLEGPEKARVQVFGFLTDVYKYSGAADIVITRAGATNLAEFALQAKACIVIPSSFLVGGHQLKNAQYLEEQGAAIVLKEEQLSADSNRLANPVNDLLKSPEQIKSLATNLASFARPGAAEAIAKHIVDLGVKDEAPKV